MLIKPNTYSRPKTKKGKIKNIVIYWVSEGSCDIPGRAM